VAGEHEHDYEIKPGDVSWAMQTGGKGYVQPKKGVRLPLKGR
jgi:hypothetical protein